MRVISLNRLRLSVVILIFIALIVLCVTALMSGNITNNLFIMPKSQAPTGVAIDMIEEINEDKFVVSYLCVSSANAKVMDSGYDAVLKGTNYTFPYAMNYSIAAGGFFSQKMQENKSRSAVLNEKAAFDMFGGNNISGRELSIGGMNYIVTGVIKDNDDEAYNIYIPITLVNKNPSEFTAPLGMETSPEYVKNELKYVGINEDKYSFIDGGLLKEVTTDKFLASLEILFFGLLIGVGLIIIKKTRNYLLNIKAELLNKYFKEIHKKLWLGVATYIVCVIADIVVLIIISMNLLEKFLRFKSFDNNNINPAGFSLEINTAINIHQISNIIFICFLILYFMLAVSLFEKRNKKTVD